MLLVVQGLDSTIVPSRDMRFATVNTVGDYGPYVAKRLPWEKMVKDCNVSND